MLAFAYEQPPTYIEDGVKAVVLASDLKKLEDIALQCLHKNCQNKKEQDSPHPVDVAVTAGSKVQVLADNNQSQQSQPEPSDLATCGFSKEV